MKVGDKVKKSTEILGLPIISISEGEELGRSKTLLIDAKNELVAAITVEDDEWYRGVKLIPYESVTAIGADAITIMQSENILRFDEAGAYENFLREDIHVKGTRAITKSGRLEGVVAEIYIGDDGKIVKVDVEAADGTIMEVAAENIAKFGKQVTVLDPDGEKKNLITQKPEPVEVVNESESVEEIAAVDTESAVDEESEPLVEENIYEPEPAVDETEPVVDESESAVDVPPVIDESELVVDEPEPVIDEPPAVDEEPEPVIEESEAEIPIIAESEPEYIPDEDEAEPESSIEESEVEEVETDDEESESEIIEESEPESEPEPEPEPPKVVTQQAEALKAALKRAMEKGGAKTQQPPQNKKQVADDRRRSMLLGKHASKTIKADTGAIIVEEGAEITEEVLQKAKLAGKFIDLSMNYVS